MNSHTLINVQNCSSNSVHSQMCHPLSLVPGALVLHLVPVHASFVISLAPLGRNKIRADTVHGRHSDLCKLYTDLVCKMSFQTEIGLQMGQYGSGPQRGPMGQTLIGGLNNVGQRGMPSNANLGQAALQRQAAGAGVNIGGLGAASGGPLSCVAHVKGGLI